MTTLKAVAALNWSLDVDCPHCNESIDLVILDSENDYGIANLIFTNRWDLLNDREIACPHCDKEFELERVEY